MLTSQNKPIKVAYFCAEYGITHSLPIYSGGLGVLAGDLVKQAADQDFPMVAVGLFYKHGYFTQKITEKGEQRAIYSKIDPVKAGLEQVTQVDGSPLKLAIPHQSEVIYFQVWRYSVKNFELYLIDADVPENESNQSITDRLYDPDQNTRIKQEVLLGIGGIKLLHALGIEPELYHLNEGHSAFAAFELAAETMHRSDATFSEALTAVRNHIVFTNHTVVAAGNDIFPNHLVQHHLSAYAEAEGLPLSEMIEHGADPENNTLFSMTILALNSSGKANTVSRLHHQIAKTVWPDYHFHSVTNGVHMPTWIAENIQKSVPSLDLIGVNRLDGGQLWKLHAENKFKLCQLVHEHTGKVFDPNVLTIIWARRFAGYKRANLVLQDTAELKRLASNQKIQIIFAGKAHPNDDIGQEIIDTINRQVRLAGLADSVVFMPNYSIDMAKVLVSGADIWLNTPRRSQEASGTSGMKAGANGVLQFSISDGWVDEVNWDTAGWMLPETQTDEAIYEVLTKQIMPLYYSRNSAGIPEEWVKKMHHTMQIIWPRFSSARMLKEYDELLYSNR